MTGSQIFVLVFLLGGGISGAIFLMGLDECVDSTDGAYRVLLNYGD